MTSRSTAAQLSPGSTPLAIVSSVDSRTNSDNSKASTTTSNKDSSSGKITRVFSRTPSSWDPQDDLLLRHLKEELKLGWKEISTHFNNRTPNACQFRWRRLRSGSLKSQSATNNTDASTSITPTPTITTTSTGNTTTTTTATSTPSLQGLLKNELDSPSSILNDTKSPNSVKDPISSNSSVSSNSPKTDSHELIIEPNWDHFNSVSTFGAPASTETPLPVAQALLAHWTKEEDELLANIRRKRSLSFTELSILLPTRTENEILLRIDELKRVSSPSLLPQYQNSSVDSPTQIKSPLKNRRSSSINKIPSSTIKRSYSTTANFNPSPSQVKFSSIYSTSGSSNSNFLSQDFIRSKSFSISHTNSNERTFSRRKSSLVLNNSNGSLVKQLLNNINKDLIFNDDNDNDNALVIDES
ncbi:hypothetical protein WICMUC_005166 [Wickerhamomyces mucosus]|uniref:Myb-like domain-containing protein n=1 Tax=Wickerhamomyces mucosus TaxID=1378264 RepID=A0A9P8P956_9ASCO|nr:hypothetical protein WICMUC_005166 [Wickerhamomyces mucosus]